MEQGGGSEGSNRFVMLHAEPCLLACTPWGQRRRAAYHRSLEYSSLVSWSVSLSARASLVARPPLARSCAEEKPEALTSQLSTTSHLLSTYLHLSARLWLLSRSQYSSAFLPYTHTHTLTQQHLTSPGTTRRHSECSVWQSKQTRAACDPSSAYCMLPP